MSSLVNLDEELLLKARRIQTKAKFLVNDIFSGEYASAFKGKGIEFEEVREYRLGDDVRSIDWKVTARSSKPFVKVFKDERELTLIFAVDVSGSAHFGTRGKSKEEVIAEITALLSYAALKNNDKIGLVIFSDHVEHYIPPGKGRGHVWKIIREILSYKSKSVKTNISKALEFIGHVQKRKAVVFFISDFFDNNYEKAFQVVSRKNDFVAIMVRDIFEISIPNLGHVEFKDLEDGKTFIVNTSDTSFRKHLEERDKKHVFELQRLCHQSKADFINIKGHESYLEEIVRFFNRRETNFRK